MHAIAHVACVLFFLLHISQLAPITSGFLFAILVLGSVHTPHGLPYIRRLLRAVPVQMVLLSFSASALRQAKP